MRLQLTQQNRPTHTHKEEALKNHLFGICLVPLRKTTKKKKEFIKLFRNTMKPIKMNTSYVILILCIVVEPYLIDGLSVGDSCQVARSGAQGVCKLINNCQPVIDDIVKQGLFPSQCGFVGRDQIVCCPIPVSDTTTTTTTPRPSRISQRS